MLFAQGRTTRARDGMMEGMGKKVFGTRRRSGLWLLGISLVLLSRRFGRGLMGRSRERQGLGLGEDVYGFSGAAGLGWRICESSSLAVKRWRHVEGSQGEACDTCSGGC